MKVIQRSEKETEERNSEKQLQKESRAATPRPPSGSPLLSDEEGEEEQNAQPDLMTLRVEYTTLSHQLAQLEANKQAGQWARLYRQVQAAEAHVRQAEQATPPAIAESSEFAKQQEVLTGNEGAALLPADGPVTDERQERLRAVSSDLLYWKGGLKVLKQARLPTWRGCFQWQIEAKIEALQTAYATLRSEAAKSDG